jgi:hypothetical protein
LVISVGLTLVLGAKLLAVLNKNQIHNMAINHGTIVVGYITVCATGCAALPLR